MGSDEFHILLARDAVADEHSYIQAIEKLSADLYPATVAFASPDDPFAAPDADTWGAIVTTKFASRTLVGLSDRLGSAVNPSKSTIVAGHRVSVMTGTAPIQFTCIVRRRPDLSQHEFRKHWADHAEFGRAMFEPYSYHQIHADEPLSLKTSEQAGFAHLGIDGIAELHVPSMSILKAYLGIEGAAELYTPYYSTAGIELSRAELRDQASIDERNFMDHSRSNFTVYNLRNT